MKLRKIDISEVEGFRLGNAENSDAGTGVTVIIPDESAVAGVDVRGGGPATRETDLLRSENTVDRINAVVLSGGSAFGLEAASGVMRELAERGIGFSVGDVRVPIVTGASLFDLTVGSSDVFPDIEMGKEAVRNAYAGIFGSGNHGAGIGASVGKMLGMDRAMKTGLGTFACGDELIQVGAIASVNACADVYNGAGNIIAGLRSSDGKEIQGTVKVLKGMIHPESEGDLNLADIRTMAAEEKKRSASKAAEAEPAGNEKEDIARALMASYQMEQSKQDQKEPEEPEEETFRYEVPAPAAEELPAEEMPAPEPEQTPSEEEPYSEEAYDRLPPELTEAPAEEEPEAEPETVEEEDPAEETAAEPAKIPDAEEPSYEYDIHTEPRAATPAVLDELALTDDDISDMGYDIPFNTTIACVITNAIITKSQANKLASILHDAYARAIKPVHTTLDGDTVFVLSTCTQEVNFDAFAALATDVLQYAIIDGAHSAESAYGLPAARDIIRR